VGDPSRAAAFIRDNDLNLSPKVEIVEPADESIVVGPADIEIKAVTVDPDGYVGKMEFYANNRLIGAQEMVFIVAPPPGQPQQFSFLWSNAPLGAFILTAKAFDSQGAVSLSDPVRILVVSHPPLPVVTIEATDPVGAEPDPRSAGPAIDTAVFTVTRKGGDLTQALKVFYRIGGTASNAADYVALSGEVVIPANAVSAPVIVSPLGDDLVEGTESVILTLEQLRCVTTNTPPPEGCYIVGKPSRALASIRDNNWQPNQPPKVAFLSPANGAVFLAPADIRLVAAAQDADGWVSTVEFFAGERSLGVVTNRPWIVEPVRLPALDGAVLSGLPSISIPIAPPFCLMWPDVPAGEYELTAVATDNEGASARSIPIRIAVREGAQPPVVTIMAIDSIAREGTTNNACFRIRRVGPTHEALTVHYAIGGSASNGTDYETLQGSAVIQPGRRTVRIPIRPVDDALPERIETVLLRLQPSPLDVFPPPYVVGRPAAASVIILDNDWPRPVTQNLPDGALHIRLPMTDGYPCRLEASADLVNWEPVLSQFSVTEEGIDYVEGEKEQLSRRFYRVLPEVEVEVEED